jgi:hypothetical protein
MDNMKGRSVRIGNDQEEGPSLLGPVSCSWGWKLAGLSYG